jgi:predicted exporter
LILYNHEVFHNQMTDALALSPFPNAIFWNWATIFILGFGNLAALDFQARCMAGKTPQASRIGCLVAGCVTLLIGIPFAYLGAITR